jgi:hypothetical protein
VTEVIVEEALKEAELANRAQGAQFIELLILQRSQEKAQFGDLTVVDRRHPDDHDPELGYFRADETHLPHSIVTKDGERRFRFLLHFSTIVGG